MEEGGTGHCRLWSLPARANHYSFHSLAGHCTEHLQMCRSQPNSRTFAFNSVFLGTTREGKRVLGPPFCLQESEGAPGPNMQGTLV